MAALSYQTDFRGQLTDIEAARNYVFGGFGRFTVVSKRTGARFTFKLTMPLAVAGDTRTRPIFVKVLSGSDNESDYAYLGSIWPGPNGAQYAHGKKSRVGIDAPSVRAIAWLVATLAQRDAAGFAQMELYHEGTCGRCGRALTVPESIAAGLGPICAGRES